MASVLLFLILFLLPFLVLPFGISAFEIPKIFIAEGSMGIFIFFVLFKEKLQLKMFFQPLLFLILGLGFWSCVTMFLSDPQLSFLGNIFRAQGVFLLLLLIAFAIVSAKIPIPYYTTTIMPAILMTHVFLAALFGMNTNGDYFGTLGEPNSFAGIAIFFWPFLLFTQAHHKKIAKILTLIGILNTIGIILITASRSALLAFLIQIIFLFLSKYISLTKATIIGVLLVLACYSLPFVIPQTIYENRGEIWKTAFVAGMSHPLIGNGFGQTENALHRGAVKINTNVQYQLVDSSHNIFLDWWVETGVIGLGLFLMIVIFAIRQLIRGKKKLILCLLLGLLVVLSFNPVSVVLLVAFWWIIGQAVLIPSNHEAYSHDLGGEVSSKP